MCVPRNIGPTPLPCRPVVRGPPVRSGRQVRFRPCHCAPLYSTSLHPQPESTRPRTGFADESARQTRWGGSGGDKPPDHGPLSDKPPSRARKLHRKRAFRTRGTPSGREVEGAGRRSGGKIAMRPDRRQTAVGARPEPGHAPLNCRTATIGSCTSGGEAAYDVVAAPDLVLADAGTRVRRVVHVAAAGVDAGVVAVRARAEDDQVADLLVALADRLAVLLLRVRLVRQLLADRLLVDVLGEARAVEPAGARGAELVQRALVPLGLGEDLGALLAALTVILTPLLAARR